MRRRTHQVSQVNACAIHCATAAAAAAAITFTGLMCAMYHLCAASGSTCGLIAKPSMALLCVGPGALIAAASAWIRAARKVRREAA